jgi:O-antigen/teichoic acid export membrane protein
LRRFFVQNIFFLILVNLIVKPLWIFGIDRNVQIAVGHEVYGQYVALLNFSIIFQVLLDFGLQSYNNRTVAQSPEAMKGLFPNIIIAKGILSFGYVILVCVLGLLLGYRGYSLFLLLALCFVQVLNSFLLYLRSNVSAMHRFRTDSILSVSDRFFMIVICSVLLFHPFFSSAFKIEWFIYAQIAAYLFTSVIAFIICTRLTKLDWSHYDLKKVWVICKHSMPYALLIFLMAVYIRSDVFLIERLLPEGKFEAGIYAAAYRFLDVSNNVTGVLFAGILLPLFGRMLAQKEAVQPLIKLSVNLLLPVAITTMIVAIFYGQQIMYLQLKDAGSIYEGKVFAVLMAAFPGYCIGYVYATLLTANGNIKSLILVSLIAVILNLVLNFILVPLYGAWGGALTCCITQCFLSVANILLAKKVLHLKADWNWVIRYPVFMVIIFICCYLMSISGLGFWVQLFIIVGVAGISMFACGFLPFRKIKELLLNR